ncbi:phage gateway protein [Aliarcobacter lanthieri]|uniref:phage gateway protein n=1 Tax=Aliarcobacter lanthieri TaxID=1355374 RepID=UPI003AA830EA
MYQTNLTQANIETIFRTNFLNCMNDYGIENIPLLQHYDYVKKGKRDIAVYFTIQNPKKIGNAYRTYNIQDDKANHRELQHYEATIQITTISDEDKTGIAPLDLAMTTSDIVGSLPFIEAMRKQGVGVQSATDIKTNNVLDESDNFVLECSLSFQITFNRELKPNTKALHNAYLNGITRI